MNKVAPNPVKSLKENEIFVFGSTESGVHGAGTAWLAHDKFGAELGKGYGLSGQSYAVPVKDHNVNRLHLSVIKVYVDDFLEYAKHHPKNMFILTEIGTGSTGYRVENIAPLFQKVMEIDNILLPQKFINFFEQNKIMV